MGTQLNLLDEIERHMKSIPVVFKEVKSNKKIVKEQFKDVPTIKEINKNFVIRWYYKDEPKKTFLIGAGKLETLIGEPLKNKLFKTAFYCKQHKHTFKLRRGIYIDFCSK